MAVLQGDIPKKMIIVTGKPQPALVDGKYITTYLGYPVEAGNPVTMQTALYHVNQASDGHPIAEDHIDNDPMTDLKLIELSNVRTGQHWVQGWKVITKTGYCFCIRDEILLDTLHNVGCRPGGILNGEFIFAMIGSNMNIIRVGSKLHHELIEAGKRRQQKKIPISDFEVGGVYADRKDKLWAFMGWFSTIEAARHSFNFSSIGSYTASFKVHKKIMLWASLASRSTTMTLQENFNLSIRLNTVTKLSHTVLAKIGTVDVPDVYNIRNKRLNNYQVKNVSFDGEYSYYLDELIKSAYFNCLGPVGQEYWPEQYAQTFGKEIPQKWHLAGHIMKT